jgi:hypothetical protein
MLVEEADLKLLKAKDDELKAVRDRYLQLKADHAAVQKENSLLKQSLISFLQTHSLPSSPHGDGETQSDPPVPYAVYQKTAQKVDQLKAQLLEAINNRALEAAARHTLMMKCRDAKSTAEKWMNHHDKYQAKHASCTQKECLANMSREKRLERPQDPRLLDQVNNAPTSSGTLFPQDLVKAAHDLEELEKKQTENVSAEELMQHSQDIVDAALETPLVPAERTAVACEEAPLPTAKIREPGPADDTSHDDGVHVSSVVNTAYAQNTADKTPKTPIAEQPNQPPTHSFKKPIGRRSARLSTTNDAVAISSRPVRRSRQGPGNPDAAAVRVKREPQSPEPNGLTELSRTETLDLDDVGRTAITPRKRKRQRLTPPMSESQVRYNLRHERSLSEPVEMHESLGMLSPQVQQGSGGDCGNVLSEIDPNRVLRPTERSKPGRQPSKRILVEEAEDRENSRGMGTPRGASARVKGFLGGSSKKAGMKLRHRLVEELQLSDFKMNPRVDHNQITNDMVSGRCLPGCIDPRCCGQAMRVIAASLKPTLQRPPFPESQEDADLTDDEYLVKWFLGAQWDRKRVASMAADQYKELLLDARTKLIAQRHGRHRAAEERRMTPPGFWDMPFPSTQDLEQQRKEAAEINRHLVGGRWEDAMRGNGRWAFRDE